MTDTPTDTLPRPLHDYITNVLPHMEGWCTPEKATGLASAVLIQRPEVLVEIGVFAGRSLIAMAIAASTNHVGHVVGIDPWTPEASEAGFATDDANRTWWAHVDHDYILNQAKYFIGQLGLNSIVTLVRATSQIALPGLQICRTLLGRPFIDFLHIDGNHSEECSVFDVLNYVPLVTPGGSVWFDDVDWSSTKQAQTHLATFCDPVEMIGTCGVFRRKVQ